MIKEGSFMCIWGSFMRSNAPHLCGLKLTREIQRRRRDHCSSLVMIFGGFQKQFRSDISPVTCPLSGVKHRTSRLNRVATPLGAKVARGHNDESVRPEVNGWQTFVWPMCDDPYQGAALPELLLQSRGNSPIAKFPRPHTWDAGMIRGRGLCMPPNYE